MKKVLFEVQLQPSYKMKCKELSILKTENIILIKTEIFEEIFKIFVSLFQFKIHEDIVESDDTM